jgi:C-5 cytosine-specific DNA methylase
VETPKLKVVDLFCGLKGWSRPFRDRGHEVWTTDIEPSFEPDLAVDMLELKASDLPWQPDIILASPPCETFSTMVMGRNWTHEGSPKTPKARLARELIWATLDLIQEVKPRWFIIENPRARLRTLDLIPYQDRRTVWYCRLGEPVAKPTDLWGGFPKSLWLPEMCHNGNPDHIAAPRGSRTGTQGIGRGKADAATRAKIPYGLGLTVCLAAEADAANQGAVWPRPTTDSSATTTGMGGKYVTQAHNRQDSVALSV